MQTLRPDDRRHPIALRRHPSSMPSSVALGTVLSGLLLISCAAAPNRTKLSNSNGVAPANAPIANQDAQSASTTRKEESPTASSQPTPQLIRRADMQLVVESVPDALATINTLLTQQQGDLLSSQTGQPRGDNQHRTASLTLRVPQARLDSTLAVLATLGTVENQSITAEDVSTQLVDFEARLKNLRRTEATLLGIMDRSGSVGDVLKVAQELSNVRQLIETIEAQLKTLQNQVAFSTITLSLEEAAAVSPKPSRSVVFQVKETWREATRSLASISIGFLNLSIWLVVYSPYLALFGGTGWFLVTRHRRRAQPAKSSDPQS